MDSWSIRWRWDETDMPRQHLVREEGMAYEKAACGRVVHIKGKSGNQDTCQACRNQVGYRVKLFVPASGEEVNPHG